MTMKNQYPLPLINDIINCLKGAQYFTKLNVCWGFNNVQIQEGDKWQAAFHTNQGLFEPLVMYFCLTLKTVEECVAHKPLKGLFLVLFPHDGVGRRTYLGQGHAEILLFLHQQAVSLPCNRR
jgi:hypothetical protein